MKSRSIRTLAVLASAGLIVGAFAAGPADAAKRRRKKPAPFSCPEATPAAPSAGHSSNASEAMDAEVINVTPAATEEAPITYEFVHGPAAHDPALGEAIMEDTKYAAFQVVSETPGAGLFFRLEWPGANSDIDLYMYDDTGTEVANSGAFNPVPVPGVLDGGGYGGTGYESISGFPSASCVAYVIESKAFLTPGETATLKVWLGEAGDGYNAP